jgi:hypothetical protein
MTTEQITALATLLGGEQTKPATEGSVWEVGKNYYIQTVTWAYTGTLVAVTDKELLLKQAALIGDTGAFHTALKSEVFAEVEPLVNDLVIGRYSIVSATRINNPPTEQK